VRPAPQSGFSLIEAVIAAAIAAVAAGAWLSATSAFGRFAAHQASPARSAALLLAEQTLRVAQDAWKYGSPGNAPSGAWTTTGPFTVQTTVSGGAVSGDITVTVSYTPDPLRRSDAGAVTLHGTLSVKAPLPGTRIVRAAPIPRPSGAP
jgi:prepilin-type N-terminal cleavage/methylation domain-containing protein